MRLQSKVRQTQSHTIDLSRQEALDKISVRKCSIVIDQNATFIRFFRSPMNLTNAKILIDRSSIYFALSCLVAIASGKQQIDNTSIKINSTEKNFENILFFSQIASFSGRSCWVTLSVVIEAVTYRDRVSKLTHCESYGPRKFSVLWSKLRQKSVKYQIPHLHTKVQINIEPENQQN